MRERLQIQLFIISPKMAAVTCPKIVAIAAPATPGLGKTPIPKISIGSRIILIMAPVNWDIILWKVRPDDCRRRSKVIWKNRPKESRHT